MIWTKGKSRFPQYTKSFHRDTIFLWLVILYYHTRSYAVSTVTLLLFFLCISFFFIYAISFFAIKRNEHRAHCQHQQRSRNLCNDFLMPFSCRYLGMEKQLYMKTQNNHCSSLTNECSLNVVGIHLFPYNCFPFVTCFFNASGLLFYTIWW